MDLDSTDLHALALSSMDLVLKWPIPGKDSPLPISLSMQISKYGWAFVGKMVVIIFIATS